MEESVCGEGGGIIIKLPKSKYDQRTSINFAEIQGWAVRAERYNYCRKKTYSEIQTF